MKLLQRIICLYYLQQLAKLEVFFYLKNLQKCIWHGSLSEILLLS